MSKKKIGPEGTAWCSSHQDFLPIENFYKDSTRWNNVHNNCIDCRKKDREQRKDRFRELRIKQYQNNKLHENISRGLRFCLNGQKNYISWTNFVNFTIEELEAHLESKFKEGMNWDNYGKWHVDHILPKSSFNFTSPDCEDFKKCWALDNLQPLWASENLSKGNKILSIAE